MFNRFILDYKAILIISGGSMRIFTMAVMLITLNMNASASIISAKCTNNTKLTFDNNSLYDSYGTPSEIFLNDVRYEFIRYENGRVYGDSEQNLYHIWVTDTNKSVLTSFRDEGLWLARQPNLICKISILVN